MNDVSRLLQRRPSFASYTRTTWPTDTRSRIVQFRDFYDAGRACNSTRKGEICPFYESTDTTCKGTFPVNTDGGRPSPPTEVKP